MGLCLAIALYANIPKAATVVLQLAHTSMTSDEAA